MRWIIAVALSLLVLGAVTFAVIATSERTHRFLSTARVVRTEEWIEASFSNPRLKSGREYRLSGSLEEVARGADLELTPTEWKVTRTATQVSYQAEFETVTLLDRPKDGEVKVIIQSYRKPTVLDRGRLWMKRNGWIR